MSSKERHRRSAPRATRTATARSTALDALQRIDHEGAFANLLLPKVLERSKLGEQDRRFTTELVYGTTRMRRACDALVDRFCLTEPEPAVRTLLRLGAYQLHFAGVAPHAAVSETVGLAPPKARGFVNAVLRRVSTAPMVWPDEATRLSYPDWIVDRVCAELGDEEGLAALERMNDPPPVSARGDGYVQDVASQWVAGLVPARDGDVVLDVCAAPGGKATAIAAAGAFVIAADLQPHRAELIAKNARRLGHPIPVITADGRIPPFRAATFDHVLIDAPCSGLGALRRRPDARWRIERSDVTELADLQQQLLDAAAPLVKRGGTLTYSVCTLTAEESIDHRRPPSLEVVTVPLPQPWALYGDGYRLRPQDADTDGMVVLRYRAIA